jgi:hypothetical protein
MRSRARPWWGVQGGKAPLAFLINLRAPHPPFDRAGEAHGE